LSHKEHTYSASRAWLLDNPFRKIIQPPAELLEKLGVTSGQTAVDFGCGPGYFTIELAKKAGKVVAVDLQTEMLKKAQHKIAKAHITNVEFLQNNGTTIQLPDAAADLILLIIAFHEISDTAATLKEFSRILKPNGKLAIVEVIKKGIFAFGPIQNPQTLQAKVEAGAFKFEQMQPYKSYGIFFFTKKP
jgi:ubiquinone/menaquinone biosynthesis C-methylase UbiE